MTFPYPHAAKFGPQDLRKWNGTTLTIPTTVFVYAVGTTTRATLYTDSTRAATATNNPVATGVTPNTVGVDTAGNLIFYAEANEYDVVADGVRLTVQAVPIAADMRTTGGSFDPSTYVNF